MAEDERETRKMMMMMMKKENIDENPIITVWNHIEKVDFADETDETRFWSDGNDIVDGPVKKLLHKKTFEAQNSIESSTYVQESDEKLNKLQTLSAPQHFRERLRSELRSHLFMKIINNFLTIFSFVRDDGRR